MKIALGLQSLLALSQYCVLVHIGDMVMASLRGCIATFIFLCWPSVESVSCNVLAARYFDWSCLTSAT